VCVFLARKNAHPRTDRNQKRTPKMSPVPRPASSRRKHSSTRSGKGRSRGTPALPAAGPALPADDVNRIRSFVWLAQIQAEHILRRLREVDELLEQFIKPVGALEP
jgi:hypothetical protein